MHRRKRALHGHLGSTHPFRRHPRVLYGGAAVLAVAAAAVLLRLHGDEHSTPSGRPQPSTAGLAARSSDPSPRGSAHPTKPSGAEARSDAPWLRPVSASVPGHLRPGSRPSVLPGSVLIADKLNDRLIVVDPQGRIRWQFPAPGRSGPAQTLREPDDAFFSPDGRYIVATQEDRSVISVIDVAADRVVFRYGVPGRPGMSANHLSNPDDAMPLGGGRIFTADIKNCRLLLLEVGSHRPQRVIGRSTTACRHDPPAHWGSPNGAFPMSPGRYLITEINGDWVDAIDPTGKVYWSAHPPGVAYPSDSNQVGRNRYLTVDYSTPGQVVIFTRAGRALWRYRGHGRDVLNHPSLALPLPNGDIILNDDFNHRVIVVDPRTNRIVWQYGHTGHRGRAPGYLDNPDGLDLVPPHSFTTRMGNR